MGLEQLLAAGGTGSIVGLVLWVLLRSVHADRDHYRKAIAAADKRAEEAEERTRNVRADKEALRKRMDADLDEVHERLDRERDAHRTEVDQLHDQMRQLAAELADARRLLARCCTQRDRDGPS